MSEACTWNTWEEFCMLNACMTSHVDKCCSFLAPASSWPLHTHIHKHGEKQTFIFSPKHMMSVCAGAVQFRETVIVQCSVSLCVFGCSRSCFWKRRVCVQRKLRPGQQADSERKEWEREREEKEESRSLGRLIRGCGEKNLGWRRCCCIQKIKRGFEKGSENELQQNSFLYVL